MSNWPRGTRPQVPKIYNITMAEANKEYKKILPRSTLTFLIHTRDESSFRLAFEEGRVATSTEPYFTIPANSGYSEFEIANSTKDLLTIYFASSQAGKVIEMLLWI